MTASDERDTPAASDLSTRLKTRVSELELHAGPLAAHYLVSGGSEPVALRGAIGVNKPAQLPVEGVVATVDFDTLDIDAWRAVIDKLLHPAALTATAAPNGGTGAAQPIRHRRPPKPYAPPRPRQAPRRAPAGPSPAAADPATSSRVGETAEVAAANTLTVADAAPQNAAATATDAASPSSAATATTSSANPVSPTGLMPRASSMSSRPAGAVAARCRARVAGAPPDAGPAAQTASSFIPTRLAAHVGNLTLLKRHWEKRRARRDPRNETWQANLASDQISGHIAWRAPANGSHGDLEAHLAKLEIPKATEHDVVGRILEQQSNAFPAVDLDVANLIVYGNSLGRLVVKARNTDIDNEPVWQLDELTLDNPAAKLTASGNWRASRRAHFTSPGEDFDDDDPKVPRRTLLDFKLDVLDAGALLGRLGLPPAVEDGKGTIAGRIGWRSGPTSINYPTLNGKFTADLHDGTLSKVDSNAPAASRCCRCKPWCACSR